MFAVVKHDYLTHCFIGEKLFCHCRTALWVVVSVQLRIKSQSSLVNSLESNVRLLFLDSVLGAVASALVSSCGQ
jgi:hypothetical protein